MPLNLFGQKSTIGVDIGHKNVRAVEIERTGAGWRIGKIVSTPTPQDSIRDGVVIDADAVGNALRMMLIRNHMNAGSAHIAVAGASVVVRNVRIPRMAEAALRKSIRIEAGRYVPSSVEDSYIEFEIIGDVGDNEMDALIVAAPKEVVESRIEACRVAGLDVESVDVEIFAAYRALVEADDSNGWLDKTVALIDIGGTQTKVSVVQSGVFTMTRTIPQGGQVVTDALMNYFKLSEEDAETGKSQLDVSFLSDDQTPRENPPLRIIQPHVDDLIREIRRSLNYFQSQQTETQQSSTVEAILIAGGGSKLPGMAEYMAHKLGIPAISAGVFDNPRFSYAGSDELGSGQDLGVAAGLAMRTFVRAA